jgi:hypothetical protein
VEDLLLWIMTPVQEMGYTGTVAAPKTTDPGTAKGTGKPALKAFRCWSRDCIHEREPGIREDIIDMPLWAFILAAREPAMPVEPFQSPDAERRTDVDMKTGGKRE